MAAPWLALGELRLSNPKFLLTKTLVRRANRPPREQARTPGQAVQTVGAGSTAAIGPFFPSFANLPRV